MLAKISKSRVMNDPHPPLELEPVEITIEMPIEDAEAILVALIKMSLNGSLETGLRVKQHKILYVLYSAISLGLETPDNRAELEPLRKGMFARYWLHEKVAERGGEKTKWRSGNYAEFLGLTRLEKIQVWWQYRRHK